MSVNALTKDCAKLTLGMFYRVRASVSRARGVIDFPIPPYSTMRNTSSTTLRHYFVSGIRCYLPIATIALHHKVDLDRDINILDFGCGVGRELLHFTKHYPNPRYFACDVNPDAVGYIEKNYPSVKTSVNNFRPPLNYSPSSMDMIYSVSTFSHLTPDDHGPWLNELFRVAKPGGYCFLTTEGLTAFRSLVGVFDRLVDAERQLREHGVLYKEYAYLNSERHRRVRLFANPTSGINGSYGNTVLTPDYIRQTWTSSGFEVIDVIEGIIDHRQDLVVLRRPA